MNPIVENVICNIVSSIICDVGKYGLGQLKYKKAIFEEKEVEKYVVNRIDKKYDLLCESGILIDFLRSPLIIDTISNYTLYVITGKIEGKLSANGIVKKNKNKCISEIEIIDFFTNNLMNRYKETKVVTIPEKVLVHSFFTELFVLCSDYIYEQMSQEDVAMVYFLNSKMNFWGNGVFSKLEEIVNILNRSIQSDITYKNDYFQKNKEYYTRVLKDNNRKAHIYLLDRFEIDKFYVPPFLSRHDSNNQGMNVKFMRNQEVYRRALGNYTQLDECFNDWKHIFERSNIVYVTGGAGYGKSLFMKKLIGGYNKLNIIDADDYLIIYGELKMFFLNNSDIPIPVLEFLQNSMKKETLIEDEIVSKELVNYYLKRGRCIILLDALDEVDKRKRQDLHKLVINYFKNQNPNNKVCITSRSRGFLPEKDVEVLEIEALEAIQIETYVDNIIRLGKFDKRDREAFLKQTKLLVDKGFLNSFLVLSLLINIYKAEREWIFRRNSACFSEIQSTLFRKSSAYLSEAECNYLINTQRESLFHVLSEVPATDQYNLVGAGFLSSYHDTAHWLPLIRGGLIHNPST